MTPTREFFSNYEAMNRVVLMGNDASCKIIRIGYVKIKMYDDVVKTLIENMHVSKFKRNRISLITLDAKGYQSLSDSKVLNVKMESSSPSRHLMGKTNAC